MPRAKTLLKAEISRKAAKALRWIEQKLTEKTETGFLLCSMYYTGSDSCFFVTIVPLSDKST